jgi:hypothetical protein
MGERAKVVDRELAIGASGEGSAEILLTVYLARLSPGSRPAMRSALEKVALVLTGGRSNAHTFPWAELRHAQVTLLRAALAAELAPRTVNRHLSAVRGILREAWSAGLMDTDSFYRATAVGGVRGTRLIRGRAVSTAERHDLFEACARDPLVARGARDAALPLCSPDAAFGAARWCSSASPTSSSPTFHSGAETGSGARTWWTANGQRSLGGSFTAALTGAAVPPRAAHPQAVGVVLERRLEETARYDRRGEPGRRAAAERACVPIVPTKDLEVR